MYSDLLRQLLPFQLDWVTRVYKGGGCNCMGSRTGTDNDAIRWGCDVTFPVPARGSSRGSSYHISTLP